jgi:hypothetical protein
VPGSFEAGHSDEEKGKLADHPAARARARLSQEARAELLTDLAS